MLLLEADTGHIRIYGRETLKKLVRMYMKVMTTERHINDILATVLK